jgi:hypothetical protein
MSNPSRLLPFQPMSITTAQLAAASDTDRMTTIRWDAGCLLKASLITRQATGSAARPTSKASSSASSECPFCSRGGP